MVWMKTYRDENGEGDLTQWQHDLATGLVTNKVYANGKGTAYAYTAAGKLARRTWARGVTTDYGYTIAGELASVDYSDATPDVSYTHDRLGRPVTMTDALGVSTNVYDASTLVLTEERWPGGVSLVRSADAFGRPSGIALGQDYAVTYGYDTAGRFGSVTANVNSTTNVVTYGYVQGSDLMAGWSSNVGVSFQRTFEPNRDLIASVTNAWNGAAVSSFAYTNDEIGRRTARVDSGLTQNSFGYNMRSEVIEAIMGTNTYGYEFDPIGNRIASTNNATTVSYTANLLNQYTNVVSAVSITPTYDDDGNMTAYGDWGFAWNGENRLIAATRATEAVSYTYDYQGRMVEKTTTSDTTRHIWDDFNIIAELGASETRYNIWGLDLSQTPQGAGGVGGLLAVAEGEDLFFACYDANGNITEYVNATGDVVATRTYSPFGETTATTGNAAAFTHWWSTKPWDPVTGFSEYEFRMYLPGLGRWVNRDPIGEDGDSLYCITVNNIVNLIDTLGLYISFDLQLMGSQLRDNITGRIASRQALRDQIRAARISRSESRWSLQTLLAVDRLINGLHGTIMSWTGSAIIRAYQHWNHEESIMEWCIFDQSSITSRVRSGRIIKSDINTPRSIIDHMRVGFNPVGLPLSWEERQYAELNFIVNCNACTYMYSVGPVVEIEASGESEGVSLKVRGQKTGTLRTVVNTGNEAQRVISVCCHR